MDGPSASSSSGQQAPLKGVVPGQVDYMQARALMVRCAYRLPACLSRAASRPPLEAPPA